MSEPDASGEADGFGRGGSARDGRRGISVAGRRGMSTGSEASALLFFGLALVGAGSAFEVAPDATTSGLGVIGVIGALDGVLGVLAALW